MTNELYLEQLLTQQNNYTKIGNEYSKDNYFVIKLNHIALTASTNISLDNKPIRLYIENWTKLKQETLKDLLTESIFIS